MNDTIARSVDEMKRFVRCAEDTHWSSERDSIEAMSIEVDHLFAGGPKGFEVLSERTEGRANIFEMEWRGEGVALADVYRDFFHAYGCIAEQAQFIHIDVQPKAIVLDIISGYIDRHAFGHFTQIRLVGERVLRVIKGYNEIKSQLEKGT